MLIQSYLETSFSDYDNISISKGKILQKKLGMNKETLTAEALYIWANQNILNRRDGIQVVPPLTNCHSYVIEPYLYPPYLCHIQHCSDQN